MLNVEYHIDLLKDYTDIKKIHESPKTIIYQGVRKSDLKSVIFKTLRSEYPKPQEIASLQHEYTLLKSLEKVPGVIKTYDLIHHEHNFILLLEDFGGISLKEYIKKPIKIEYFFTIATKLLETLQEIHNQHITHKDINPHNILVNPKTLDIKLSDFSIASQLSEEVKDISNPLVLEGTLAYISPEQTGRMNHPVDYRSDFYSLGVTFYEMLAQHPPFDSLDPLELVSQHLAKNAPSLSHINSNVPKQVAMLIAKLMAKNPDERYNSAEGIKADILRCAELWKQKKTIEEFPLGFDDQTNRLNISHKLYGREEPIKQLLEAYQRITEGEVELMLISGYAGIGKTSLVKEVHKPMVHEQGTFIAGKFDELQRNIPYNAFIQAFSSLIHQILMESEDNLAEIRERILEAVGRNGQVLVDVIPEMEHLIGKQSEIPVLGPAESQNRFMLIFQDFVHAVARREHPLVIYLDDLQWADTASLKLLELLLTHTGMQYLFIVGAYRNNEVHENHPLTMTLQKLQKAKVRIDTNTLQALSENDISHLLMDTLQVQTPLPLEPLTKLIHAKTAGNPFFINEFLKLIYQEKCLIFDVKEKVWKWDVNRINALNITDNVVDLMISNIHKLSHSAQDLLIFASCIGNTFDLNTLTVVCELKTPEVIPLLWESLQAGFILPVGENYKLMELTDNIPVEEILEEKITYRFLHDRVQQAAYSLIPESTKQQKHLIIGSLLLKEQKDMNTRQLFDIMNHFNKCLPLIKDPRQKKQLADLFLRVGKAAKSSTAYQAAAVYLQSGITLLDSSLDWEDNYQLMFELSLELAECSDLIGQHEFAEQLFNTLLERAKNKYDKTKVYIIMILLYSNSGKLDKAIDISLDALKLYGLIWSKNPSKLQIIQQLLKVKWAIGFKKIENFELFKAKNPDVQSLSNIWADTGAAVYLRNPLLFAYLQLSSELSLFRDGYTDNAPIQLFGGAALRINAFNDIKTALAMIELGDKALKNIEFKKYYKLLYIKSYFCNHLKNHASTTVDKYKEAIKNSLQDGDFNYATIAEGSLQEHLLCLGIPLADFKLELQRALELFKRIQNGTYVENDRLYEKLIKVLSDEKEMQRFESFADLKIIETPFKNKVVWGEYLTGLFILFYLTKHTNKALEYANSWFDNEDYRNTQQGKFPYANYLAFYAIIIADHFSNANATGKKKFLNNLKTIEGLIRNYYNYCPINYSHLLALVQAENARLKEDTNNAEDFYDKAIESAKENNFPHFAAIINERAAEYYIQRKKPKFAKTYIQEACYYYMLWGATAKAKQLERQYPHWLKEGQHHFSYEETATVSTSTTTDNLDILSIVKSTQAISVEIELEKLLKQMLQIVLENAGAERCVLLFEQEKRLIIAAEGYYKDDKQIFLLETQPLQKRDDLPHSILSYVIRTKETILADNISHDERFNKDLYIQKTHGKSVLCFPVLFRGKSTQYLYLENSLVEGAFTKERIQALNILSAQVGISLENSRLYTACNRFVPYEFMHILNKHNIVEVEQGDQILRKMTVLFCDIRGFSTISEKLTPSETFRFINTFLKQMEPVISQNQGFIDKYIGDAIMALFPEADDAVNAALAIIKQLKTFNEERQQSGQPPIEVGIGINTGELMLGILGGDRRLETSVIGDAVNIAARMEELTKKYHHSILITDVTKNNLMHTEMYYLRKVDEVVIRGRSQTIGIWEVKDLSEGFKE